MSAAELFPLPTVGALVYDRCPLRCDEVAALQRLTSFSTGGSWSTPATRDLSRLVAPIHDAINGLHLATDKFGTLGNKRSYERMRTRATWPILRQVHTSGRLFWEWSEQEWQALIERGGKEGRVPISAVAYVLCGIRPNLQPRLHFSNCYLYKIVFGQAAWDRIEPRITRTLVGWGFAVSGTLASYTQPLAALLLDGRVDQLEDLTRESFERFSQRLRHRYHYYARAISMALHHFGIIEHPLAMQNHPRVQAPPWDGIAGEWTALTREWQTRAVYGPSQTERVITTAWKVGKWLAEQHADITRPEHWTPELAAHFLRSVMEWTTGQYLPEGYFPVLGGVFVPSHRGRPLTTNTKIGIISALRILFRDLRRWKLVGPLQIDPSQDLAVPRALARLSGANPRDIRQAVWMKLVWASLNLGDADCRQLGQGRAPYSSALIRAIAVLWTHAGLRSDELNRLEVGCVRELTPGLDPEFQEELDRDVADLVCLLSVPVNKTSSAFTKPVGKVVAEYVRAWEAERGEQPTVLDRKTRQSTHYLFMRHGRKLGTGFLNRVLIPLLCRKAGVPHEDVPGKRITSHRGRASLATWYYNTRDGMALEELQRWLGHSSIQSTERYVRPSPIRQAKKFARAHANSYVMDVLVDTEAIASGAAAKGAAWQYYPLGDGDFCTNPFYAKCPHRMACARCEFHLPAESQVATALVAKQGLQHMLLEMPLDEDERAAVEGGVEAMELLIAKRRNVPTPDGRTPAEIITHPLPPSFIPLSGLAS